MSDNDKLKNFISKFRKSKSVAAKIAVNHISNGSLQNIIETMNRGQLKEGEDATGKDLGEYGAWRKAQREEVGLQTDFIDLKFEGNFYESIYAEGKMKNNKPAISIDTTSPEDWNAIREDDRFKDALGLNQENRDKVGMMIATEIRNELLKYYT